MRALILPAPTGCVLLVGALLLGALGAGADDYCPPECYCSPLEQLSMECKLSRTNVTVEKPSGSIIKITCHNGNNFTFEEFPQIDYGLEQTILLVLFECAIPSFELAASRLGASAVEALYFYRTPEGEQLTADKVEGLDSLKKLAFYPEIPYNMNIPTDTFARLPLLQGFTVNRANMTLREGDFATAPGLKYLELSFCNIDHLPDGIFSPLAKLEILSLFRNKIEDISENHLRGLESLRSLEISGNKLRSLRGVAATSLKIHKLSIFANRFDELPSLRNLTYLEEIKLVDNEIKPLKIAPGALASLPRLQNVTLSRNGLRDLPSDLFRNSLAIRKLELKLNDLVQLPPDLFEGLSSLEELDLSYCKLRELNATVFWPLEALTTLILDYNELTTLPPNGLSHLYVLHHLSVSHNQLQRVTNSMLSGSKRLATINLSYNNISDPQPNTDEYALFSQTFSQRDALITLDLSHNQLTSLPQVIAQTLLNLQTLNLSYNRIEQLMILTFVSNKLTVDLTHNNVSNVWLEPASNATGGIVVSASGKPRSTVLLDDNPFWCDCDLYFFAQRFNGFHAPDTTEAHLVVGDARCAGPPSLAGRTLRSLPLRDYVCDIDCSAGCDCILRSYTKTLELTCENLPKTFPTPQEFGVNALELRLTQKPSTFLNISAEIRVLNLSGLALEDMPAGIITHNVKLLDISNNNFSTIPRDLIEKSLNLKLAKNPLICDCWHADDVAILQDNRLQIEDYSKVNCSNNIPISQVNVYQLCSTLRASVIGGLLALFGIITIILAVLLLKYSFEIKVWLYSRGMFARWLVVDDDDRKYDAFISFCHKDEEFVSEHLLPGLENIPQPYKLCIHYRDWMPGEFITTQIAQSVADSRRTIIVVSKNFLESQWARAEFRTANMSAIKEQKTRVIAILLEDVSSHKKLDPELKAYLSTNTYLKWGDPWFWDKLRYALPHRKADNVNMKKMEKAEVARKLAGVCGLDTRLTADGVIINAAAGQPKKDTNKCEQINLDICHLDKIKNLADNMVENMADLKPLM